MESAETLESQVRLGENSNDVISPPSSLGHSEGTEDTLIGIENYLSVTSQTDLATSQESLVSRNQRQTRNVKRKSTSLAEEVLQTVSMQLNNSADDKFDTSCKNIANKLRSLSPETAIVTEKLLSDVIFEAQMGKVTRYSKVIIQDSRSQSQNIQSSQSQNFASRGEYYSTFASDLNNVFSI